MSTEQATQHEEIEAAGRALEELKAAMVANRESEIAFRGAVAELEEVHERLELPSLEEDGPEEFVAAVKALSPVDQAEYGGAVDEYRTTRRDHAQTLDRVEEAHEALRPYWPDGTTLGQLEEAIQAGGPLPTAPAPEPTEPGLQRVSGDDLVRFADMLREDVGEASMATLRDHFRAVDDEGAVFHLLHHAAVEHEVCGLEALEEELGTDDFAGILAATATVVCSRLQHGPTEEV